MPRLLRAIALTAVMTSIIVACAPHVRDTDLAAEPESSLAPAGAVPLGGGAHGAADTIDGPVPAVRFTMYGTSNDIAAVESFYRSGLESHGWVSGGGSSGIPALHEQRVVAWRKSGLIYRLALWKIEEWRACSKVGLDFPTVFDASLISAPTESDDPAG